MKLTSRSHFRRAGAFTLLEVLTCIFIFLLIAGMFLGLTLEFNRDTTLDDTAAKLERLSRKACRSASAQNRRWVMVFEKGGFRLLQPKPTEGEPLATTAEAVREPLAHQLPEGVEMEIQRLNSRDWKKPGREIWEFTASGLCEPIAVRFTKDKSYVMLRFNPLTGLAEHRESYFP